MRRVNYMLKVKFDLSDLEKKSKRLVDLVDRKVEELDSVAPEVSVREYMDRLTDEFMETTFDPLEDIWEEEIRRLFDKYDLDEA